MYKRLPLVLLTTTFSLSLFSCSVADIADSNTFDPVEWRNTNRGEENVRYRMVDSLQEILQTGMSQGEVHQLLGTPDIDSNRHPDGWLNASSPFDAYEIRFYYNIIDYDTDYFIIEYDSDNLVRGYRTATLPG